MDPGRSQPDAIATCHCEPRGHAGLEGYQLGSSYRYQKRSGPRGPYYRIYYQIPGAPGHCSLEDYSVCGPGTFQQFFKPHVD